MTLGSYRNALTAGAALCVLTWSTGAHAQQRTFNIPAEAAADSIPEFARQAGLQILAPDDGLTGVRTSALSGQQDVRAALRTLLAGTGLSVVSDSGRTIVLRRGAAAIPPAAAAQGAASDQPADVSELVVTAEKRSERLIDTPQSVSVLTADALAATGATQFRDFADTVPGLSYQSSGAGQTQIFLRGVTAGDDTSPTVGIVVDDVPIGSSSAFVRSDFLALDVGLFDVDRIEVLRGPQGTLYGASTMGGLIKYVSKAPDAAAFGGEAQSGVSSTRYGGVSYNAAVAVNAPLVTDRIALRASGFYSRDGGYVDNLTGDENANRSNIYGLRADLLFKVTDRLMIKLGGLSQDIDRRGTNAVDYDRLTGRPIYGSLTQSHVSEPFNSLFRLVELEANYDLDVATVTSISSYQHIKADYEVDYSAQFVPLLSQSGFGDYSGVGISNVQGTKKFTQELRVASNAPSRLEWLVGGFFTHERSRNDVALDPRDLTTRAPAPNTLITVSTPTTYEEVAGFANATLHLTSDLDVAGGVRYARNSQHYSDFESGAFAGPALPPAKSSDATFTYLADARYHFGRNATAYLRYATAYRPGGPNGVAIDPFSGQPLAPPTFQPDQLRSYEAGLKAENEDHTFAIDASGYYIDWSDIQVFATRNGFGGIANEAGATVTGAELSLVARPAQGLVLTGAFAYQDPRLSSDAPDIGGAKGERLPNVPRFTAALNADAELVHHGLRPTVGVGLRYISDRMASFNNSPAVPQYRLPEYVTVDLRAAITAGSVRLNMFVRNLFDTRGQLIAPTIASSGDVMQVAITQPRTIGVEATTHF